jgi:hypothetical protein
MEAKYDEHGVLGAEADEAPPGSINNEYNLAHEHNQLERGLKSRHIQFLALGMELLFLCAGTSQCTQKQLTFGYNRWCDRNRTLRWIWRHPP